MKTRTPPPVYQYMQTVTGPVARKLGKALPEVWHVMESTAFVLGRQRKRPSPLAAERRNFMPSWKGVVEAEV